jgi:hypothetical protein
MFPFFSVNPACSKQAVIKLATRWPSVLGTVASVLGGTVPQRAQAFVARLLFSKRPLPPWVSRGPSQPVSQELVMPPAPRVFPHPSRLAKLFKDCFVAVPSLTPAGVPKSCGPSHPQIRQKY